MKCLSEGFKISLVYHPNILLKYGRYAGISLPIFVAAILYHQILRVEGNDLNQTWKVDRPIIGNCWFWIVDTLPCFEITAPKGQSF